MKKTTLNIGATLFNLGDYITAINGISVNQSNVNEVLKEIKSDNQVIFNIFMKSSIFSEKYSHQTEIMIQITVFMHNEEKWSNIP